jgi:hypothetical protein
MLEKGLTLDHLSEQFQMLWGRLEQEINSIPAYSEPVKHEQVEPSFSSRDADEIMKFLHRVATRNEAMFPANKARSFNVEEPRPAPYHTNTNQIMYAPVSTLEGALVGLCAIGGLQVDLRGLVAAIDDDLLIWVHAGVAVPVLSIDLTEGPIFADLLDVLRPLGEKYPFAVEVEFSENQIMSDTGNMSALIQEINNIGLFVGIRNFGTGYSSLSVLRPLPIKTLWIDGNFIYNVAHSSGDKQIVQAIASVAESLGVSLVAEAVSNAEQSKALLDLGIKNITGGMAGDLMSSEQVHKRIST